MNMHSRLQSTFRPGLRASTRAALGSAIIASAGVLGAISLVTLSGCAVSRGQSTVGEYVDDASITTQVKARMVENKQVDAAAISVETLNGTVLLSGFAKSGTEKAAAESSARGVKGVKSVRNEIVVRAASAS